MQEQLSIKNLTEPKETAYFIVALVFSCMTWLLCVVTIIPVFYAIFIGLFIWLANGLLVAQLKSNAVRVDASSFPVLAGTFARVCSKMQLAQMPELYVLQSGGSMNAFATRHCGRDFVVVYSEMLEAYGAESPEIEFLLGHEIGHIQRSHLKKRLLLFPGLILPLLGNAYHRACELTCDRYGAFATSERQGAVMAMMVLAGGKQAPQTMSPDMFARQYAEHRGFFVSWFELISGYPTLSQRVANLIALRDGQMLQRAPRNFFAYPFAFFTFGGGGGGGGSSILITVAIIAMLAAIAIPSFVKSRDEARRAGCANNRQQMQVVKEQIAQENKILETDEVPLADLEQKFGGELPVCRAGGRYTLNPVGQKPECSVHALDEQE